MRNFGEVKEILGQYGQEHVLNFYNQLDSNKQIELLQRIPSLDLNLINGLYNNAKSETTNNTFKSIFDNEITNSNIKIDTHKQNAIFNTLANLNSETQLKLDNILHEDNQNASHQLLNFFKDTKQENIENITDEELALVQKLYKISKEEKKVESDTIEPIAYMDKTKLTDEEIEKYTNIGIEVIKKNEYAVVTMAGGQGTRLGYNGPKGSYVLDVNPPKSLFEIMCDNLKNIKQQYDVIIPWYIMTSRENNDDTIKFFEDNNYFDYPKDYIKFFIQGELPMLFTDGKIVMENKWKIKEGADGHGGIFNAMKKNGIDKDMKNRGIKYFFVCGIDNILAKLADLVFIGMMVSEDVLIASKSVVKDNPKEKVGVFCLRNGRPSVVEYSEISEDMSNEVDEDGELKFGEANILAHIFNIEMLEKIDKEQLPYHVAFKKTEYVDDNGDVIEPEKENAYKFETFIFDAFYKADKMLVLRVKRNEEFAPIKNKEGVDSPETAKELYNNYWNK